MIKSGSRVRMNLDGRFVYGEVTIVNVPAVHNRNITGEAKVLWDGDVGLDYWYFPLDKLEEVEE